MGTLPEVGSSAVKVHSGPLLVHLHDNLTLLAPAVLAEVSFGQVRVNNVVMPCPNPKKPSVQCDLSRQAKAHTCCNGADQGKLIPHASVRLQADDMFKHLYSVERLCSSHLILAPHVAVKKYMSMTCVFHEGADIIGVYILLRRDFDP